MTQKLITFLLGGIVTIFMLVACNSTSFVSDSTAGSNSNSQTAQATTAVATTHNAVATNTITASATAATVLAENTPPATIATTAESDSGVVQISLQGNTISVEGDGVTVEGSRATITTAGTYTISGTLEDGQIMVDTDDEETVYLILNGVTISNSTSAPIYIKEATAIEMVLADNSDNYLSDASSYIYASAEEDEPNAALFSDDLLVISGNGSLTVEGNYNDGIAGKDGLIITGGAITVTAADDGIRGKDYLVVEDGYITVNAGGDGLKSDNEEDATLGYISVTGGALNITAGGDGMQAQSDLVVTAGDITVVAGGGSGVPLAADLSAKGLKAEVNLALDGGTFTINAADDALHSNTNITINGGTYTLASGDDGVHGESTLTINNGEIQITDSYEGLEGATITINAGNIMLVSSDDGVNAAGGTATAGGGRGGAMGGGNYMLYINGGTLVLDAGGDGLDANGTITMTDGVVVVNGPTERMNGALDVDGGFTISGGTLIAVGSSGMATAPGGSSSQNSLLLNFTAVQAAGTPIHIEDSAGNTLLTFTPTKAYQSLAYSSPTLQSGQSYEVYLGGSVTGNAANGISTDGSYSGGTAYTTFTVSGVLTQIGSGGGFGGGRGGPPQ